MLHNHTPTVLTIAGSDPYGGAGIQIDSKTIHAVGGYAFSVITALTAQNSIGVRGIRPVSPSMLRLQLETLLDDVKIDAVKIGVLANEALIEVVVEIIDRYKLKNIILDTVMVSSSGKILLETEAIDIMIEKLFPLTTLITPNLMETNHFLGRTFKGNEDEVIKMAEGLFALGANNVLLKGGHSDQKEATDYFVNTSLKIQTFTTPRVRTTHTHGTGCILSSAIATYLSLGYDCEKSVEKAKIFLYEKLNNASALKLNYQNKISERREAIF